ncbi:MAG: S4 domain-containing protein YaaA [Lactobacillales bacterium]|jgi:S4 domain protein YaaA|nr:S4 domain-containing protein YaaA [Lactobacillales bacterium]
MEEIVLLSEYLTLGQILKELGVISTGGQAKYFLKEQKTFVNNQPENRRGRKLYSNDILTLPDTRKILLRSLTPSKQETYEKIDLEEKD